MTASIPATITQPWCYDTTDTSNVTLPPADASTTVANQATGFPESQEEDPTTGGEYVKRNEVNGVFKLYSAYINYMAQGGKFTFDSDVASDGGYDEGVVLWSSAYGRLVESLQANNTDDFESDPTKIDGVSWGFADLGGVQNIPSVDVIPDLHTVGSEVVIWAGAMQSIQCKVSFKISADSSTTTHAGVNIDFDVMGSNDSEIDFSLNRYVEIAAALPVSNVQFNLYYYDAGYYAITLKIIISGSSGDFISPFTLKDYTSIGSGVLLNYNSTQIIGNSIANVTAAFGTTPLSETLTPITIIPSTLQCLNVVGSSPTPAAIFTGDGITGNTAVQIKQTANAIPLDIISSVDGHGLRLYVNDSDIGGVITAHNSSGTLGGLLIFSANSTTGSKISYRSTTTTSSDEELATLGDIVTASSYSSSSAYVKFADGLIIQTGKTSAGVTTVTFPISFTNAVVSINLTFPSQSEYSVSTGTVTTSSFTWERYTGTGSYQVYWTAIGY